MKIFLTILFIIFFFISSFSQEQHEIDSLKNLLEKENNDSVKFDITIKLFNKFNEKKDTSISYEYLKKAKKYLNIKDKNILIYRYSNISNIYRKLNNFDSIIFYYKKIADIFKGQKKYENYINYMNWAGYYYTYLGEDDKSVEILLDNLRFSEKNKITKQISRIYMFLAFGMRRTNQEKAKEYFELSLKNEKDTMSSTYFTSLNELGNIYNSKNNFQKAIYYYERSLKIKEILKDGSIVYSYNDLATLYHRFGDLEKAAFYMEKTIPLREKTSNKYEICFGYINLSSVYIEMGKFNEAKIFLDRSLKLAEELKMNTLYKNLYNAFYSFYKKKKDFKNAMESFEKVIFYKDSINEEESVSKIAELDKKYKTEKKEAEIKLLQKDKEKDNAIIQKQKILVFSIIIFLILMIILAFIFFKSKEKQKKANEILFERNVEINQQKEEIQVQAEHLKDANNSITKQKNKIEESHKQIRDSINYASRIQNAIMPNMNLFEDNFSEYFIMFKPKDIVSGDFYWAKKINEYLIFVAADCTGHGIPGAFVSMLGVSLLNEIVRKKEIKKSNQILNELRKEIKISLRQDENEIKDGMDLALCIINTKKNELQFSGANNPLYLFRNNELIEFKADRQPIGIYRKEKDFTNHVFQLEKNDLLYMFSDGYLDQFGGEKGRKFMRKQFKEVLHKNQNRTMIEQKNILNETFENWKKNTEQIDDVLVLGVKI